MKSLILMILLSQTPYHKDTESWQEREERMEIVADGIVYAADRATCYKSKDDECKPVWTGRKSLALLLVTQAVYESNLAEHVHKNQCRLEIGECDSRRFKNEEGKWVYEQRSFSPWQIKRFRDITADDWVEVEKGVPGTKYSAWHAARRLASAYRSCGSIVGALSRYGRGNGCHPTEQAPEREEFYRSLNSKTEWEMKRAIDRHRKAVSKDQRVASSK